MMEADDVATWPETLNAPCHATPTHRYCCCCYRTYHHQHQVRTEAAETELVAVRESLTAEIERLTAVETTLRRRVWALRPALALAVKRLHEVYPSYENHHEGGEIMRVIEIGERALAETAGPTRRVTDLNEVERLRGLLREAKSLLFATQHPTMDGSEHRAIKEFLARPLGL